MLSLSTHARWLPAAAVARAAGARRGMAFQKAWVSVVLWFSCMQLLCLMVMMFLYILDFGSISDA
jgi:hypothetical protein